MNAQQQQQQGEEEEEFEESASVTNDEMNAEQQQQQLEEEGVDIPFFDAVREAQHRSMALSCLERDAAKAWSALPDRYKTDKEFILTALRRSKTLPSKADFERRFPQSIRFDRDVVLAFLSRSDFEQLYYERLLHVPHVLTGDKQVMLAYCQHIPRSLQNCSEELTDNVDVVRAAVTRDGMELQYASRRLQSCKEMVMLACQTEGRALEICPPGPVRDELVSDKAFMLDVLRKHGGPMLRLVSESLRHDSELLLEALKHGMRFRYVPLEHQVDAEFLLQAVQARADVYLELPRSCQVRTELALAAITSSSCNHALIRKALELLPTIRDLRPMALAIAKHAETTMLEDYFVPPNRLYCNDKEVMLEAVKRHVTLFSMEGVLSPRLLEDVDIILAAMDMTTAPDILRVLSAAFLQEHPMVALTAVRVASPRSLRLVRQYIPDVLWRQDRDLAIAWIRRGCRVLDPFERLLQSDEEFCLEVAEHSWHEFAKVSERLRSDWTFMTKAVDRNGLVLRCGATAAIRDDLHLAVRAVASHCDALNHNSISIRLDKASIQRHIQERLNVHNVFVNEFLRGISTCSQQHLAPAKRCLLPLLDRGEETSQALKRLIGLFLGVLTGPELKLYRTAWKNLTTNPPPAAAAAANNQNNNNIHNARNLFLQRQHAAGGGGGVGDAAMEDMLMDVGGPFDMFEDHHHEDFLLERIMEPAVLREHRWARRHFLHQHRRREQLWREQQQAAAAAVGPAAVGPAAGGGALGAAFRPAPLQPQQQPLPVEPAAARRMLRIRHAPVGRGGGGGGGFEGRGFGWGGGGGRGQQPWNGPVHHAPQHQQQHQQQQQLRGAQDRHVVVVVQGAAAEAAVAPPPPPRLWYQRGGGGRGAAAAANNNNFRVPWGGGGRGRGGGPNHHNHNGGGRGGGGEENVHGQGVQQAPLDNNHNNNNNHHHALGWLYGPARRAAADPQPVMGPLAALAQDLRRDHNDNNDDDDDDDDDGWEIDNIDLGMGRNTRNNNNNNNINNIFMAGDLEEDDDDDIERRLGLWDII